MPQPNHGCRDFGEPVLCKTNTRLLGFTVDEGSRKAGGLRGEVIVRSALSGHEAFVIGGRIDVGLGFRTGDAQCIIAVFQNHTFTALVRSERQQLRKMRFREVHGHADGPGVVRRHDGLAGALDRKSTRLNSSH